jgi:site-specific recombinase
MDTTSKLIGTGLFLAAVFASGFWLSHSGKPYSAILFNLHKLIGLGAAVFLVAAVYLAQREVPLTSAQIAAMVVTGIIFILTIVAGGLVSVLADGGLASLSVSLQTAISIAHKVLPYLAVLSTAVSLYLLFVNKQTPVG